MFGLQGVTVVAASAAFVFGMVLAATRRPETGGWPSAPRPRRRPDRLSAVGGMNLAGTMPMMLATGLLVDSTIGVRQQLLIGGSILTAAAIFVLGLRPSYAMSIGAVLLVEASVAPA